MIGRRSPQRLAGAVRRIRTEAQPRTLLGAVQSAWTSAAGAAVAAEATPVGERDGVVTIACRSATWAQELDLLQGELLERLNQALADRPPDPVERRVQRLRFRADGSEHF